MVYSREKKLDKDTIVPINVKSSNGIKFNIDPRNVLSCDNVHQISI